MAKQAEDTNFQLMAWIKRQQEQDASHREKMVLKHAKEDEEFMEYVKRLVRCWGKLSTKDKLMVIGITKTYKSKRCLSLPQRSAVVALYLKHQA